MSFCLYCVLSAIDIAVVRNIIFLFFFSLPQVLAKLMLRLFVFHVAQHRNRPTCANGAAHDTAENVYVANSAV